jgi:hypothetical protein
MWRPARHSILRVRRWWLGWLVLLMLLIPNKRIAFENHGQFAVDTWLLLLLMLLLLLLG